MNLQPFYGLDEFNLFRQKLAFNEVGHLRVIVAICHLLATNHQLISLNY